MALFREGDQVAIIYLRLSLRRESRATIVPFPASKKPPLESVARYLPWRRTYWL